MEAWREELYQDELYHHGILGMKWGRRNGPPYPLSDSDHSAAERKAGWKQSLKKAGDRVGIHKVKDKRALLNRNLGKVGLHYNANNNKVKKLYNKASKAIKKNINKDAVSTSARKGWDNLTDEQKKKIKIGAGIAIGTAAAAAIGYAAYKRYGTKGLTQLATKARTAVGKAKVSGLKEYMQKGISGPGQARLKGAVAGATKRIGTAAGSAKRLAGSTINDTKRIGVNTANEIAKRSKGAVGKARKVTTGLNEIRKDRRPIELAAAAAASGAAGYAVGKKIEKSAVKNKPSVGVNLLTKKEFEKEYGITKEEYLNNRDEYNKKYKKKRNSTPKYTKSVGYKLASGPFGQAGLKAGQAIQRRKANKK